MNESHTSLTPENEWHVASILTLIKNQATENLEAKKIFLLGSALQIITGTNHHIGVFEQQTALVIPIKALIGVFYLFAWVG